MYDQNDTLLVHLTYHRDPQGLMICQDFSMSAGWKETPMSNGREQGTWKSDPYYLQAG